MKLSHNGEEWHGSFVLAATAIIEDVLSDGEPFLAKLVITLPDGGTGTFVTKVHRIKGGVIKLGRGSGSIEVDELLSIEVL